MGIREEIKSYIVRSGMTMTEVVDTQENEGLKEKVNSEKSIQKQMEVLTLKKENERLRRFVDSIPPEVRRILREQQRQQRPKDHDL